MLPEFPSVPTPDKPLKISLLPESGVASWCAIARENLHATKLELLSCVARVPVVVSPATRSHHRVRPRPRPRTLIRDYVERMVQRNCRGLDSQVKQQSNWAVGIGPLSISGRHGVMNKSSVDRRLPLGLFPGQRPGRRAVR